MFLKFQVSLLLIVVFIIQSNGIDNEEGSDLVGHPDVVVVEQEHNDDSAVDKNPENVNVDPLPDDKVQEPDEAAPEEPVAPKEVPVVVPNSEPISNPDPQEKQVKPEVKPEVEPEPESDPESEPKSVPDLEAGPEEDITAHDDHEEEEKPEAKKDDNKNKKSVHKHNHHNHHHGGNKHLVWISHGFASIYSFVVKHWLKSIIVLVVFIFGVNCIFFGKSSTNLPKGDYGSGAYNSALRPGKNTALWDSESEFDTDQELDDSRIEVIPING